MPCMLRFARGKAIRIMVRSSHMAKVSRNEHYTRFTHPGKVRAISAPARSQLCRGGAPDGKTPCEAVFAGEVAEQAVLLELCWWLWLFLRWIRVAGSPPTASDVCDSHLPGPKPTLAAGFADKKE